MRASGGEWSIMWESRRRSNRGAAIPSRRSFLARLLTRFIAVVVLLEAGMYAFQAAQARRLVENDAATRHMQRAAMIAHAFLLADKLASIRRASLGALGIGLVIALPMVYLVSARGLAGRRIGAQGYLLGRPEA